MSNPSRSYDLKIGLGLIMLVVGGCSFLFAFIDALINDPWPFILGAISVVGGMWLIIRTEDSRPKPQLREETLRLQVSPEVRRRLHLLSQILERPGDDADTIRRAVITYHHIVTKLPEGVIVVLHYPSGYEEQLVIE